MAWNLDFWDNTAENVVYTSKVLTNSTQYLLFCYNLCSTDEPKASNICLEYICGELYPFIKNLLVRDEQTDSCTIIGYKPPLFL